MSRALDQARDLGGRAGLRRLGEYQRRIAAVESQILANHVQDDGDTRRAERLLDDGKTSKAQQRRKANRAKAVGRNKGLADKLATGEMSEEQVDVIADASSKTDGDAAIDPELIDRVASVPPEQGRGIADDFVAKRATRDGVQTEHNRQRTLRRASTYRNKAKAMDCIALDSDGVSHKLAWKAIEKRANEIYQRDGGRDLPDRKHPRTRDQRLHDAVIELITGKITMPNGETRTDTSVKTAGPRPQIVVGLTIDNALGTDPAAIATQIGLGLIPDSVVANYAGNADFFAALFDRSGQPLWLARLERYASNTQMLALILRDRGCVLCGADHARCQAHHTMPWSAPGKGRTDLDQLVLLCGRCHHQLHANERTIFQDVKGTWRTRPATPDETPAARPTTTRNQVRRE